MLLTEIELLELETYLKCNLNLSETAKQLHYHRNTIQYHFKRILTKTGKDPFKIDDLIDLLSEGRIDKIISDFSDAIKNVLTHKSIEIFDEMNKLTAQLKKDYLQAFKS